jgi:dipeptidase E
MKILLASNSGEPFYEWLEKDLVRFVNGEPVTFISAATVYDVDEYFKRVEEKLNSLGIEVNHLNLDKKPEDLIANTKVFLVGGGNTYNLLNKLDEYKLSEKIHSKVKASAKYIGISAGANIAGPTILTTNDWNVVGSTNFKGLELVHFNINPHYIEPHDKSVFSGETRDERILEHLVFNDHPVVAIEEKTLVEVDNKKIKVGGRGKAKVFFKNQKPKIFKSGESFEI